MSIRTLLRSGSILLFCLLAGCSSDPMVPIIGPPPPPPPLPVNNTPEGAVRRFNAAYEQKKAPEYQGMFSGDFTFEFSNSTDPSLVSQYSTGWFKTDEKESSSHLFFGYTPPGDSTLPAASSIDINFAVTQPSDDNSPAVDPATHKILATRVDGLITVPSSGQEPLTFVITNNFNVFYIVRGDKAVSLDSNQPADSLHWYIYRWVDLTSGSPAPSRLGDAPVPTQSMTWSKIRARYHG